MDVASLAAWLQSSKSHPFAAKTGLMLASRLDAPPLQSDALARAAPRVDPPSTSIDALLATLAARYRTPIPEAYLSEAITAQQAQRRQQGVFYTPWPLAQYLMRSAAKIAQREFPGAVPTWLDPACGGGIFFLSHPPTPPARAIAWDASPIAISLARSIFAARFGDEPAIPIFQQRDALLSSPQEEPFADPAQPLVIVGNPPYSNFGKRALSPWLAGALLAYRPPAGERKTNLRDMFLLFLRLAESLIAQQGRGVMAMVLSTTFLDAITHSQVRASLSKTFDELRILRLDDSSAPPSNNLFAIRRTTAACLFLRRNGAATDRRASVFEASLEGPRDQKLAWLGENDSDTTPWRASSLDAAREDACHLLGAAPRWYREAPALPEIFGQYLSGVQTKNDGLFLARSHQQLEEQIRSRYGEFDASLVQTILVAPFDPWLIYYDPKKLGRARYPVMRQMLKENLGLIFMRQATTGGDYDHFLVTRHLITDRVFHSRWGAPFLAPLYLWDENQRTSNLRETAPEDWLAFAYAIVQSDWYKKGAENWLKRDFPRIPRPEQFSAEISRQLMLLGGALIQLHAPEGHEYIAHPRPNPFSPFQIAPKFPRVETIGDRTRIFTSRDRLFAVIPSAAWNFRLGGVEVLRRFLLRRRGTFLMEWEVGRFQEIVRILLETIRLQGEINALPLL